MTYLTHFIALSFGWLLASVADSSVTAFVAFAMGAGVMLGITLFTKAMQ
jgi:hypothetical protein